jgi:hypothetical protein
MLPNARNVVFPLQSVHNSAAATSEADRNGDMLDEGATVLSEDVGGGGCITSEGAEHLQSEPSTVASPQCAVRPSITAFDGMHVDIPNPIAMQQAAMTNATMSDYTTTAMATGVTHLVSGSTAYCAKVANITAGGASVTAVVSSDVGVTDSVDTNAATGCCAAVVTTPSAVAACVDRNSSAGAGDQVPCSTQLSGTADEQNSIAPTAAELRASKQPAGVQRVQALQQECEEHGLGEAHQLCIELCTVYRAAGGRVDDQGQAISGHRRSIHPSYFAAARVKAAYGQSVVRPQMLALRRIVRARQSEMPILGSDHTYG